MSGNIVLFSKNIGKILKIVVVYKKECYNKKATYKMEGIKK